MKGRLGNYWSERKKGSVITTKEPVDQLPNVGNKSKTWETTVTRIPSWPEEARPLKQYNWLSYFYLLFDMVLVLLPLYFILLAIAVITLNGAPTKNNDFGSKVEFAIDLGPTMFPIVFAAVSGRSMKMIARYLAERGARISTLELLMASQSVWGTIESQLLMQRLTLVGVNLLFLWTLSPLGGQASLRLMRREDSQARTSTPLRYMTTGPGATMWGLATTYEGNGQFTDAKGLYTAALLAPQSAKLGPRDPWGNVKIPNLEALNENETDSAGWLTVPSKVSKPEMYTSLVGIPLAGLPSDDSSFSMEYTYISTSCEPFRQSPCPGGRLDTNWTLVNQIAPGQVWKNKTSDFPWEHNLRPTSFLIDTDLPPGQADNLTARFDAFFGHVNQSALNSAHSYTQRRLHYISTYMGTPDEDGNGARLNIGSCQLSQHHVEAMIRCFANDCAVKKIRKSLSDTRPTAFTGFEHSVIMDQFAHEFPMAINTVMGLSSPTERFLADSSVFPFLQQVGYRSDDARFVDLSLVPIDVFSNRLSLLINTFYQVSMQPTGYYGNLTTNLTAYGPNTLPVTDINTYLPSNLSATDNTFIDWWSTFRVEVELIKSPFIGATADATVTSTIQKFACNVAWLALLMASSGILFSTGVAALILKHKTLGPEMFGFVSSMTYENPWIKIPKGGSMLDAMERARLLKDVEVYIGDVHGNEDVGHIALAAGVPLRRLERGRLYS